VVEDVRGRGSSTEKGLATAHSMNLRGPDGSDFRVGRLSHNDDSGIGIEFIAYAKPMRFERCPICLAPDPSSDEHVPPKSLGGSVMTSTCEDCNNKFGSLFERTLADWWEDALGFVSFGHQEVRGARKMPRILMRQKDSGEPVFFVAGGRIDPDIAEQMVPESTLEVMFTPPDPNRYRLAALKSAYLGACLLTRSIPETPEADSIRAELMHARNLRTRERPEISPLCANLTVAKTDGPAAPGEIALVRTRPSDGAAPEVAISLARTLLVSWPIGGYLVPIDGDGNPQHAERL
ncbi:HNH endonuclease, partial [Streptomyces sp. NPDC088090]